MILLLRDDVVPGEAVYTALSAQLDRLPGIRWRFHEETGTEKVLREIYLIGSTSRLEAADMSMLPGVERVIKVSQEYRILGRHKGSERSSRFEYNGLVFSQDNLHVFAGLCAVDNEENVAATMAALKASGLTTTRMGAYKPRTSPYAFQGHGASCLPYVFRLADEHGIAVIAMEVTHERQIDEIEQARNQVQARCGVMLQIGTRNTQNFELLKAVGRQKRHPVLLKRGFGITLDETLNAAEYLASEGNTRIVLCLRGVKSNMGDPHRNLVDFAHVPTVKRLTRMPVCIDPSHSVGIRAAAPDGLSEIHHATAQGVIAGANMVLVDFHPRPAEALVDSAQALPLDQLGLFLEDVAITRRAYEARCALAQHAAAEANAKEATPIGVAQ